MENKKFKGLLLDEKSAKKLMKLITETEGACEVNDPEVQKKYPGARVMKVETNAVDLIVSSYTAGLCEGQVNACKIIRAVIADVMEWGEKELTPEQIKAIDGLSGVLEGILSAMKKDRKEIKKKIKKEQPLLAETIKRFKDGYLLDDESEEAPAEDQNEDQKDEDSQDE